MKLALILLVATAPTEPELPVYDVLGRVRDVLLCDLADAKEQLAQLQQKIDRMITANEWLMQDRAKVIAELQQQLAQLREEVERRRLVESTHSQKITNLQQQLTEQCEEHRRTISALRLREKNWSEQIALREKAEQQLTQIRDAKDSPEVARIRSEWESVKGYWSPRSC
jgi:gamma-glutamyl-gamma-aminobutyrate hydrolase PuuD